MEGIKEVLQIPISIKPFVERDGAGDPVFGDLVETTCYAEETFKVIVDKAGKEVISSITFYLDGSETISDNDVLHYFGKDYNIKISSAVRELNGDIALWVVNV